MPDDLKKFPRTPFARTDMDFTDEEPAELYLRPQVTRDQVQIPTPTAAESPAFQQWLAKNAVHEPFHPDQHYDYVGAYRAGEGRQAGSDGHFTDRFKLPGHEKFSNESQYAKGKFANAPHWDYEHPDANGEPTLVPVESSKAILQLLKILPKR